ncbi:MAG: ectonucleotide pyrophosphatase/phosphodiesterase [Rikenellaceae bacterium]
MKKSLTIIRVVVSLTLLLSIHTSLYSRPAELEGRHVVILSMDGFRWDYTLDAHTPTLDSLRRVGSYSQMMPIFPSNTFPSHYAMATGLYPNHHGVTNNSFYDAEADRIRSVFDAEDCNSEGFWGGEPIWNTVELQGGIAHIHMWPGSEYVIGGRQATQWQKYDHNMDYFQRADNVVASMSLPEDQVPNLVMWYMPDPDEVGHHTGPNSAECIARVEYIDSVLSYFFAKMRETPYFEDVDFIVTSDHGMAELSEERYINLYHLLDHDKVIRHISGSPFCFDVDEDYLDEAVALLNAAGNMRAYRGDSMPEEFHYGTHPTRCTNLIILPDTGWKLDYREKDGSLPSGGSHGFDPFDSQMQVVFFGAGPSFKRGYSQPTFQNQNIYLIICHILGVDPAEGDWNMSDVESMFAL